MNFCLCLHYRPHSEGMGEGNVFTGVSPFTPIGVGVPHPRSRWGGYAIPGQDGGYPILLTGGSPSKIRMGGTLSCWWGGGVPHPRSGWGGTRKPADGGGTPSKIRTGGLFHFTDHHSKHLLHDGRCASCVHAGGLSCSYNGGWGGGGGGGPIHLGVTVSTFFHLHKAKVIIGGSKRPSIRVVSRYLVT